MGPRKWGPRSNSHKEPSSANHPLSQETDPPQESLERNAILPFPYYHAMRTLPDLPPTGVYGSQVCGYEMLNLW